MDLFGILDKCNDMISTHIENTMERVPKLMTSDYKADRALFSKIGLDPRVGVIYISREAIAAPLRCRGTLDYYGGFEYVDKADIITIGDYVIYLASDEDSRVREHIANYYGESHEEE